MLGVIYLQPQVVLINQDQAHVLLVEEVEKFVPHKASFLLKGLVQHAAAKDHQLKTRVLNVVEQDK